MHFLIFALSVGSILFPVGLLAQLKPQTISELVTYNGKDREAMLYAGAKSEGKVTWYTSLSGDSYKGMAKAFEAKYPGVKLDAYRVFGLRHDRAHDGGVEGQALHRRRRRNHRRQLDVHARCLSLASLSLTPFRQLSGRCQGKRRARIIFLGHRSRVLYRFCLQQEALSKNAVPKNYEGLLHPELKGRMGVSVSDPAYKVIGAMLRTKGQEFVKKLKVQEIALHTIIPPALLELIASGEVLASPGIFRNHTLNAISKGAPVEWVPMDIVPTNVGGAAIAVQPPHPHGALLLADYLLGSEGQAVLEKYEYGSAAKKLGFKQMAPGPWHHDRQVRKGAGALGKAFKRNQPPRRVRVSSACQRSRRTIRVLQERPINDASLIIRPISPITRIHAIPRRTRRPAAQTADRFRAGHLQRQRPRSGALTPARRPKGKRPGTRPSPATPTRP